MIATGIGRDILVVGGWPFDWSLPYQTLLSLKIALAGLKTALALVNRCRFVPHLADGRLGALRRVRAGILAELWLGLAVSGLVVGLGSLDPLPAAP